MKDRRQEAYAQPQQILEAAQETIAQHKISGSRMRQIAANGGMSQGNLHYCFPSKAELFLALLETFVQAREEVLNRASLFARSMGSQPECKQQAGAAISRGADRKRKTAVAFALIRCR